MNIESQVNPPKKPEAPPELEGRESVPIEAALDAQNKLIRLMMPDELLPYLGTDSDVNNPVLRELGMSWVLKYAESFAEYCDNSAKKDVDLMKRMAQQTLTEMDLESIRTFLESPEQGGVFFTPQELTDFIKENVH